jgi:endonuclease/exonuclease/phosphatase family metal-dependent hydrolase
VTTWNIHGSAQPDLDDIAGAIVAADADVVVLQEVQRRQVERLAVAAGMRFTWALKHRPYTQAMWWRSEGMAIMTPHLLDAAGHTEVTDRQPMRSWRRRIAQWALVGRAADGQTSMVMVFNLHLSPHDAVAARRAEASRVAAIIADIGTDTPPIIAGDLNDDDDPEVIASLPAVEFARPSATCPADAPVRVLDHVLVPATATGVTASVPRPGPTWASLSDHLPVTVDFRLPITPGV